ncbi:MAG: glycosyltransferase family 4 protein [Isosphaeraceae bacterium]
MTAGPTTEPSTRPNVARSGKLFALVSGDFVKTAGMDRANYALASYLLERGDEVHFASYRVAPDLLEKPGAILHRVRKPMDSYLLAHPILSLRGRKLAARIAARGGRVVVNGGNCPFGDINWLHHLNTLDLPRTSGNLLRRIHRRSAYRLYIRDDRRALQKAGRIITTCERNKADLIRWLGTPAERVDVVYYGTEPQTFHPPAPGEREELRRKLGWALDRPVVAFVGALGDSRKGFDTLFKAWVELCADPGWDAQLVVAGTGAELPLWQARAVEAGIGERIAFLGFRRDVPDLMRASDAHVLPSRYEGYSLVTQEALCCGLPAFVTATAGIAERYPEELQDLLIPDPEDAPGLAAKLRRWHAARGSTGDAVSRFSARLRSYTWNDMAAQFMNLVESHAPRG